MLLGRKGTAGLIGAIIGIPVFLVVAKTIIWGLPLLTAGLDRLL